MVQGQGSNLAVEINRTKWNQILGKLKFYNWMKKKRNCPKKLKVESNVKGKFSLVRGL